MFNFIKQIFTSKDDLVGIWQTSNEGGFHMISGSELILLENGKGKLSSWGSGYDEPYSFTDDIEWFRKDIDSIALKTKDDLEFKIVSYCIEKYSGAYNIKYDVLFDPNYDLISSHNSRLA